MNISRSNILKYVRENGYWAVPEYKGGYDDVSFTHDQFIDCMDYIEGKYKSEDVVDSYFPITNWEFEVDGQKILF